MERFESQYPADFKEKVLRNMVQEQSEYGGELFGEEEAEEYNRMRNGELVHSAMGGVGGQSYETQN